MKLLLDTHIWIWSYSETHKLSSQVTRAITDPSNERYLSAVSIWEAAIKIRSGRLDLEGRTATDLVDEAKDMDLQFIDLEALEAATHSQLTESTHFDPFDRMLIWQAISRDLTLISGDKEFERFRRDGLKLLWK